MRTNRWIWPVGRRAFGPPAGECLDGSRTCSYRGSTENGRYQTTLTCRIECLSCSILMSPRMASNRKSKRGQRGRPLWLAHIFPKNICLTTASLVRYHLFRDVQYHLTKYTFNLALIIEFIHKNAFGCRKWDNTGMLRRYPMLFGVGLEQVAATAGGGAVAGGVAGYAAKKLVKLAAVVVVLEVGLLAVLDRKEILAVQWDALDGLVA